MMANSRSIYLVLDMENDLVHDDGPNGTSELGNQVRTRGILARTSKAIAQARAAGLPIGFVTVGFKTGYPECPAGSPLFAGAPKHGLFQLGAWGTEVHPDLDRQPGDLDIVKHRVSPFYATTLEAQLRAQKIERIYCSGVSTQAVVQATVRDGHDRDYEMIVLEDACAAHSAQEHVNSIDSLRLFCKITTTDEVVFER
ncbi:cysteine hydrolase [Schauerella aestuarii]|uniref:cysteine hydrolase n=1 Tax=Schauerella aestuarii TaxID=2511204 RepID=UPI001F3437B3|nr:cysteine hydrolase [Achromobacter aestuarii]